jgi:hypothetical protein
MLTTTFEKALQQGLEQGRLEGLRRGTRIVLEARFGPLSAGAIQRLNAWPTERLEEILRADKAVSLKDLGLQDD